MRHQRMGIIGVLGMTLWLIGAVGCDDTGTSDTCGDGILDPG